MYTGKKLTLAATLLAASFTANAGVIATFDTGPEIDALSIDFGDFTVEAGSSINYNLAVNVNQTFNRTTNIAVATVNKDTSPPDGGLGVKSRLSGSTDNLEGSLGGANNDEVLFFDFDFTVSLTEVLLNAGVGNGHQDLFPDNASDVFGLFTSANGLDYTSVSLGNLGILNNEILNFGGPVSSQWFAIAHVGPVDSVGGYIESIEYVPAPSVIALMFAGFLGLGFARRRRSL